MAHRGKGELEAAIMTVLWDAEKALTAREVQERFTTDVPAITTLITVLDRMVLKGLVTKSALGGRSYSFAASRSRLDDVTITMNEALSSVDDKAAVLMHFAGSLSKADRALLRKAIDG